MRSTKVGLVASALCALVLCGIGMGRAATITLDLAADGPAISPLLYGIFFEDINCSADGGLYAELVRNRNFEDSDKPDHWSAVSSGAADVKMAVEKLSPAKGFNRQYLRVTIADPGAGRAGVVNTGYWGISVEKGARYELSLLARAEGGFKGPLAVSLESGDGLVYAESKLGSLTSEWKPYSVGLKAANTDPKARLVISTSRAGSFCLDMVSLFPRNTWKNRPNGLRPDLARMLADLKPGFVRFPGGCWVEGETMDLAYRWKETIGKPSERRTQRNIWQYKATHGIGYHEYLQMCEDLGAEPLFVINCGMSHKEIVPMEKMDEYVQDALDAVEYANGPATTRWGALRAANGHPAPFHLKYMEIGNENGGPRYHERYALFHDALKKHYPGIHLVANEWNGRPNNRPVEIIDEHYYSTPEFFMKNANKYDTYDRSGRKVYVGEYAVTRNGGQGNLRAAVGEAAFMIGMERNGDVVVMSSYAPLFANVNYKKWNPDMINFDSARVFGLPGYYVQKMFSQNRGDKVLPLKMESPEAKAAARSGAVGVGTWNTQAEFKDLKVARDGQTLFGGDLASTNGWRFFGGGEWSVQDGALRQQKRAENIRAFFGDKNWNNYTYTLKARKIGGAEGFLIPILVSNEDAKTWWNLGGWGNTKHAVELDSSIEQEVPGNIETGRWYDLRVEVKDANVRCFLDGKLLHNVNFPATKSLYAVASKTSSDLIVKVVNVSFEPQETRIALNGRQISSPVSVTTLTSPNPEDENSLEEPTKVSPSIRKIDSAGSTVTHTFPPNSVTVLRARLR